MKIHCPRCYAEIPAEVSGCPHCMQAIDDIHRTNVIPEEPPETRRTPFDRVVLTYLARREVWLASSIVLSPLAILLGLVGVWPKPRIANNPESKSWTIRYLKLGVLAAASWVALFGIIHYWPKKPYPVEVTATGYHVLSITPPGSKLNLTPRTGFEWIVVEAEVSVRPVKEGKKDDGFMFRPTRRQFRMILAARGSSKGPKEVDAAMETSRFGEGAFPEGEVLHRGEKASGTLLFMAREAPPTTKLVFRANPDPKTGKPRLVREFEIPVAKKGLPAPSARTQAPAATPGSKSMPGDGMLQAPTTVAPVQAPMPGEGKM